MGILKFENTPYEEVQPGLNRKIIHTNNLMTVLIDFTGGPWDEPDPMHHHLHEQISYVAAGTIIFFCEGEVPVKLETGDLFSVASGVPHSIQLLSETARLIDSFNPIREDFIE